MPKLACRRLLLAAAYGIRPWTPRTWGILNFYNVRVFLIFQVRGVKGEAVVIYREPLKTKEMGYYRLSRRVNNTVNKPRFLDITWGCVLIEAFVLHRSLCLGCFTRITPCYLCNYRENPFRGGISCSHLILNKPF